MLTENLAENFLRAFHRIPPIAQPPTCRYVNALFLFLMESGKEILSQMKRPASLLLRYDLSFCMFWFFSARPLTLFAAIQSL